MMMTGVVMTMTMMVTTMTMMVTTTRRRRKLLLVWMANQIAITQQIHLFVKLAHIR